MFHLANRTSCSSDENCTCSNHCRWIADHLCPGKYFGKFRPLIFHTSEPITHIVSCIESIRQFSNKLIFLLHLVRIPGETVHDYSNQCTVELLPVPLSP